MSHFWLQKNQMVLTKNQDGDNKNAEFKALKHHQQATGWQFICQTFINQSLI